MRTKVEYQYDSGHDLCVFNIDSELAAAGFRVSAFGSDYEDANTMFAVWIENERVETRRPESLLVSFLSEIVDDKAFLLKTPDKLSRVDLNDTQQVEMAWIARDIYRGLKDSPLGDHHE